MGKNNFLKSIKIGIAAFGLTYLLELVNASLFSLSFYTFLDFFGLIMLVYSGIIYGGLFGILYQRYYDKLYGNYDILKALELILILWFFAGYIPIILFDFPYFPYQFQIIPYLHGSFLLYILTALIFTLLIKREKNIKPNKEYFTTKPKEDEKNKSNLLEQRLRHLINKDSSLNLDDVEKLLNKGFYTKESLKEAEHLIDIKEKEYDSYVNFKKELHELKNKMTLLTDRVAEGDVDSESYKRAADDLEAQMKVLEEKLWKLRNKLFKDDYEKPF